MPRFATNPIKVLIEMTMKEVWFGIRTSSSLSLMDMKEEYAGVTSTSSGFVGASVTRACHSDTNLPEGLSLGRIPTILADVYRARNLGKASLETSLPFGRAIISTGTISEAFSTCESILAVRGCKYDVVT